MSKISKTPAPIHADQTLSEAFATILAHNLGFMAEWEDAARLGEDIEGVHQVRVSFRRMRSALQVFRPMIPRDVTNTWAQAMKELVGRTGMARDLDVFIDEGLGPIAKALPLRGADKMMAAAARKRAEAYDDVRVMLDSDAFADFKRDFTAWIDSAGWEQADLPKKNQKRLLGNVVPAARKLLDRQERIVLSTGSHVDQDNAADMHQLRIECKKLRYTAEFFVPLFAGMDDFIRHMKGLQDLLGVMNDVAVMSDLVDELVGEDADTDLARYAGALVGWRTRQYYEIKETFDERWDEFVHAKHPWWKKSAVIRL